MVAPAQALVDARFVADPQAGDALAWLLDDEGGAVHVTVVRAKPPGLLARQRVTARQLAEHVQAAVADADANRVVLWHAEGAVAAGDPVAVVGAAADHRRGAWQAIDLAMESLRGVAQREDLSA